MSEAERLQKIVEAQEKELRRLRKLLSTARVAAVEFEVEGTTLRVVGTCIGVDEYHFLEKLKPEILAVADAIIGAKGAVDMDTSKVTDLVTGEPMQGAVSPGSAD